MVTLNANRDTTVFIPDLEEFAYYLFVFEGCNGYSEVYVPNDDCELGFFTMNVNIPMGVYTVNVYGQSDYSNTDISLAEYLTDVEVRIYNPEDICWTNGGLTDEFNYPLQDENEENLID